MRGTGFSRRRTKFSRALSYLNISFKPIRVQILSRINVRFHWRQLEIAFQCLEEIQKEPVGSFYMRGTGFEPAQALSYRISLPDFFIEKVQHLSPARLTTPTPPHCRAVLDEPKHIGDIRHPRIVAQCWTNQSILETSDTHIIHLK